LFFLSPLCPVSNLMEDWENLNSWILYSEIHRYCILSLHCRRSPGV